MPLWGTPRRRPRAPALLALVLAAACGGGDGPSIPRPEPEDNPEPVAVFVTPAEVPFGTAEVEITVAGGGFVRSSVVRVRGASRPTTYVSETQLRAAVTAADLAEPGPVPVTVFNPTPGGGVSEPVTFVVANPAPTLTAVTPAFVLTGSAGATVTVTGTAFVRQSSIVIDHLERPATYVSPTELRVTLTAADVAAARAMELKVRTPPPGGGTSGALPFEVRAPAPAITSLETAQAAAGSPGMVLRINGTGFVANSQVRFAGAPRPTNRVSATRLEATLTELDLRDAGRYEVTVATPAPGGGVSNAAELRVTHAVPTITLLPTRGASAGRGGFTLMVHGTGFAAGTVVRWNGANRPTTYLGGTRVMAQISAADVASTGTGRVTVHNPAPGGGTSAAATVRVRNVPAATVTSSREVEIPAGAVVWSAATGRLYASVPGSAPSHANHVVAIDPATGAVTGSVAVGPDPGVMAISDDGQVLYVALRGATTIRRVAAATLAAGPEFAAHGPVEEIAVMPGRSGTVAVSVQGQVCLYDEGVPRPRCTQGSNTIAFGESAGVLYGHNNESSEFGFRTLGVVPDGLDVVRVTDRAFFGYDDRIHYAAGRVYSEFGPVADAGAHVQVGVAGPQGEGLAALPDAELGRVFILQRFSIEVYDINHFALLGSIPLSGFHDEHPGVKLIRLVRWGTDGLAFRDGEKIHILRSPIAGP
jgi:IPT/TIG domain